ncbi:B3 domain-containing protein REM16-like isoform X2 [Chenopodium quinoa]|uniref:B3 domain-containing protein REM16-like isoform X2 n=1 Tax=Chenopodium quinoa TaxID=63459 RepID=UPI000B77AABC|nr:B3 domain-containing protein REM16-like isoform X2 [Chenopodium quinoa]
MEEKSDCENCRTWEEEMYWKHFNSMHFYQILPQNFHDHLVLPEKFAMHMKTHLPEKLSLKGPSGNVWQVDIQTTDNVLLVGNEWKDFVKTYKLRENCLLMFKYKRNSSFEVLIFDQESLCEEEASYFMKKCSHTKPVNENHKKRIVREGSNTNVIDDDIDDDSAYVVSKKSKNNVDGEVNCLGREENTQNPRNQTFNMAIKKNGRGRPRKIKEPCNSLSKSKAQPKEKPGINEATHEVSQVSLQHLNTPENGESSPRKDHSKKLKDQFDKNPSGNDAAQEPGTNSGRDWSTPEYREGSLEMNNHHKSKTISGKEPSENGTSEKISQFLGSKPIVLNFEECSPTADDSHSHRRKRGRPKKQAVPMSSMKQVSRSVVSSEKECPEYVSNRRAVTEMEKADALLRANQEQTEKSFTVVMRPSSVYRRFYLSIPADWMNKHLALQNQDIILRVENNIWHAKFYYNGKRCVGGLSGGWKKFAFENSLEEFDVLLFKLANPKDDATVFDVEIFRVIPKILPPLQVSSSILT